MTPPRPSAEDFRRLSKGLCDGAVRDAAALPAYGTSLVKAFAGVPADDVEVLDWLDGLSPSLASWMAANRARAQDALVRNDPAQLALLGADLAVAAANIVASPWVQAGLSARYQAEAAGLCGVPEDAALLRTIDGAARAVLRGPQWPKLGVSCGRLETWEGALTRTLGALGVPAGQIDVTTIGRGGIFGSGDRELHIPARDAALLLDDVIVGQRAAALNGGAAYPYVRRLGNVNQVQLPLRAFLGLRGVQFGLPANASDNDVFARVQQRITERGGDASALSLSNGVVVMEPDDARLLLAPVAAGDPATQLTTRTFEYDPTGGDDAEAAVVMAQCAIAAYKTGQELDGLVQQWGLTAVRPIANAQTDAQAVVIFDKARNTIIVAGRGTESRADMRVDAQFGSVAAPQYGRGMKHKGFVLQTDSILGDIDKAVADFAQQCSTPPTILADGHSLGGSIAMLYAAACAVRGQRVPRALFTYGQPQSADETFFTWFHAELQKGGAAYYRYVNANDIVPRMPPGFVHGGTCLHFDDHGALYPTDGSGNKPRGLFGAAFNNGGENHRARYYLALVRKARDLPLKAVHQIFR